jgi:hypothetical protein
MASRIEVRRLASSEAEAVAEILRPQQVEARLDDQHAGVGVFLVAWAAASPVGYVFLRDRAIAPTNSRAEHLYERRGYRRVSEVPVQLSWQSPDATGTMHTEREQAWVMAKSLPRPRLPPARTAGRPPRGTQASRGR